MKLNYFERLNVALTFSEVGEWDKAKEIAGIASKKVSIWKRLQQFFVAISFAEEGLYQEALGFIGLEGKKAHKKGLREFLEEVGLSRAPVHFLVVRA